MTDIDFDELDKAVNSVMSTTASAPTSPSDTSESVAIVPDAPKLEEKPEVTAETVSSSLAKRRGRFMDVVHPSSDMKVTPPPRTRSREGVSITPSIAKTTNAQPAEESQPETAGSDEAISTGLSAWPDPLETQAEQSIPEADQAETDDSTSTLEKETTADPLSSPFLPDAKVEKRPLGGSQGDSTKLADEMARLNDAHKPEPVSELDDKALKLSESKTDDEQKPDEPEVALPEEEASTAPLPAELDSDLVAIEAGDATGQPAASEDQSTETDEKPAVEVKKSKPEPEAVTEKSTPKPAEAIVTAPVVGSIAQQYKEIPSSNDDVHTSIYDADSEIAPLEHLTKKKSGWLYGVLILLALLIGGGAGAAIYFWRLI